MSRSMALAACAILTCSTAANAQNSFGRLVDPKALTTFAQDACGNDARKSNGPLAAKAKLSHWDELGRTAATPPGSRAWMVSLKGQPVIVDVAQTKTGRTCSVSAVTDPNSVIGNIIRIRSAKPKMTKVKGNSMAIWPATNMQPHTDVTYGGGQAMARITYTFSS